MREIVTIRINTHQEVQGVTEYTLEMSIPGQYDNIIVGASQAELTEELNTALGQILTMLGIPATVSRPVEEFVDLFTDSEGNSIPVSGFAASAKATFDAQVIRNGVVVEE